MRGFALIRRELQNAYADPAVLKELDRLEQYYQARGEAVDALDRAEAEVERLREEKRVLAENETWAQAEVERLRAILRDIERLGDTGWEHMQRIRAALAGEKV